MEQLHIALTKVSEVIDLVGIAIILIGALKFLIVYGAIEFRRLVARDCVVAIQRARLVLGGYILVALEFMICSDIITSVVVRTIESLGYLAGVVVLRTTIGFFLERELRSDLRSDQPNTCPSTAAAPV